MEKDRIQTLGDILSTYMDPQLVSSMLNDRSRRELCGFEHEAAVLFVDIRHFNAICEKLSPAKVAQLLSIFQQYVMEMIHRYGGIVDKMMGDCTMAYWLNLKEEPEEDNLKDKLDQALYSAKAEKALKGALRAAHSIFREIDKLEKKAVAVCGYPLEIAVGIHYGPVFFGNIGSETRKDFTVVGNTVNIAARLKEMTPAGKAYVTETVMERISNEFTFLTVMKEDDTYLSISCREGTMVVYELVQKAKNLSVSQLNDKETV